MSEQEQKLVSVGKHHREIIVLATGIGRSQKTGKTRLVHKTVHQTKISGTWVDNKSLPNKRYPPRKQMSVLLPGFKH